MEPPKFWGQALNTDPNAPVRKVPAPSEQTLAHIRALKQGKTLELSEKEFIAVLIADWSVE